MSLLVQTIGTSASNDATDTANGEVQLEQILRDVAENRIAAVQQLRDLLTPGLRWFMRRKSKAANLDFVADAIVDKVLSGLHAGELQTASQVQSFMRLAAYNAIDQHSERTEDPATQRPPQGRTRAMRTALDELTPTERNGVERYLQGENVERICADLRLTAEQFAMIRSRLQTRFTNIEGAPKSAGYATLSRWLRTHSA